MFELIMFLTVCKAFNVALLTIPSQHRQLSRAFPLRIHTTPESGHHKLTMR